MNNLNKPISHVGIKAVIKNLTIKKSPGPYGFSAEFFQNFQEELKTVLFKAFHIIETEESFSNSFYEVTVTLILKPHKDSNKKENYRPVSFRNIDAKFSIKYWQTEFKSILKNHPL